MTARCTWTYDDLETVLACVAPAADGSTMCAEHDRDRRAEAALRRLGRAEEEIIRHAAAGDGDRALVSPAWFGCIHRRNIYIAIVTCPGLAWFGELEPDLRIEAGRTVSTAPTTTVEAAIAELAGAREEWRALHTDRVRLPMTEAA